MNEVIVGIGIQGLTVINTNRIGPKSEPALELHSRAAPSVEAHHCVSGPNTGKNSGGRRIKKPNFDILCALLLHKFFSVMVRPNCLANGFEYLTFCFFYSAFRFWHSYPVSLS